MKYRHVIHHYLACGTVWRINQLLTRFLVSWDDTPVPDKTLLFFWLRPGTKTNIMLEIFWETFIVSILMLPYPFWGIFEFCFECYWHIITNNTKTQWCLESTGLENWLSNLLSVYCILSNKYQLLILHLLIYYVYVTIVYNTIIMVL